MLPLLLSLTALAVAPVQESRPEQQWGQWRGPLASGEAPHATPPVTWSEEENLRWKIPLTGRGHSSPVVWGEHVFLTTAIPMGDPLPPRPSRMEGAHDNTPVTSQQRFVVQAYERKSGTLVWERTVHAAIPSDTAHVSGGYASPSPITDGEHLFASFGSAGLYALDLQGTLIWSKNLGEMQVKHSHGEGSGPALWGETLVVNWDHEGDSFLLALNKATGEERWRVARKEPTSWATPIIVPVGNIQQVIVPGTGRLRGYDLEDGRIIWECGGLSHNVVASPVHGEGIVVAASSYEKQVMLAVSLEGATGDLTGGSEHLLWVQRRLTPYVPSPLLYQGVVYGLVHYQANLCRTELTTGDLGSGSLRIRGLGNLYASPVAAAGRVYLTDLEGRTLVLEHTPVDEEPRALALNQLDDSFSASAALAGSELFLRGDRFLYCLAED